LIVAGEGGVICTNDEKIAALCRSIKSHGRPDGSTYFEFQRVGFNAKWNELGAAIALDSLATFDKRFVERRSVRAELIRVLSKYEWDGYLRLFRQERGEVIAPHGFAIVLQDERADVRSLYDYLEQGGVECKTLWGSLPTQHKAFDFMNHTLGDFPVAERLGNTGLHFGCHDGMSDDDINHISSLIGQWLMTERRQRIAV
jgi:dTDP-4-amino-4,6-dideoxygalactose transaminase